MVDLSSWQRPVLFDWLQEHGGVEQTEMLRTFNCGVGMVICVAPDDAERALNALRAAGEQAWVLGTIEPTAGEPRVIYRGETGA